MVGCRGIFGQAGEDEANTAVTVNWTSWLLLGFLIDGVDSRSGQTAVIEASRAQNAPDPPMGVEDLLVCGLELIGPVEGHQVLVSVIGSGSGGQRIERGHDVSDGHGGFFPVQKCSATTVV